MSCQGDGMCLQQCSHKRHNGYCPSNCQHRCQLVECHNFKMCGQKRPQSLLECYNGMCMDCFISYGKLTFLDVKEDCIICMENKEMVVVTCGKHKVCIECWKKISTSVTSYPLRCPLCREPIWK
jgi:hypothetical protein